MAIILSAVENATVKMVIADGLDTGEHRLCKVRWMVQHGLAQPETEGLLGASVRVHEARLEQSLYAVPATRET